MNPEQYRQAWKAQSSQTRLAIDAELLLDELRRQEKSLRSMLFWRDVREVGTALLLVPVWLYLGVRQSSPWTWYLMVPALLWVAAYMLVDRMRHTRRPPDAGEPLRHRVESSLAQVEHQIGLLRNVLWWYLLPLAFSCLAFIGQVTWQVRAGGWSVALAGSIMVALVAVLFFGVYWLNQYAVRHNLEPRRRELESLLISLNDEASAAS